MDDLKEIRQFIQDLAGDGRVDADFADFFIRKCEFLQERLEADKATIVALRAELARKDKVARRACEIAGAHGVAKACGHERTAAEAACMFDACTLALGCSDRTDFEISQIIAFAESEIPPVSPMLPADAEGEGRR